MLKWDGDFQVYSVGNHEGMHSVYIYNWTRCELYWDLSDISHKSIELVDDNVAYTGGLAQSARPGNRLFHGFACSSEREDRES